MAPRTATCSCGALTITVDDARHLGTGLCHCLACQRRTGSVFAALAYFEPPFTVGGTSTPYERRGDSGARFTFHFCPSCGTTLFHIEAGEDGVSVAVGGFADPAFPAPTASVYDCRRHPWVRLPDGVAVFATDPE